jgi:hypothetical protein
VRFVLAAANKRMGMDTNPNEIIPFQTDEAMSAS